MVWRATDPQGDEAGKIAHMIVPWTRGRGLDIGCGPFKAFPHMIGIDDHSEYAAIPYRPDIRSDVHDLAIFADNSLDFCFSSHLLEHLPEPERALREWWRVIRPGGHLVLYLPHRDFYPNIGQPGSNPDHRHDFAPRDIVEIMERVGRSWDLIENQDRNDWFEYSFYQVYRKGRGTGHRRSYLETGLPALRAKNKVVCVSRYGAHGDHIQASSALAALKEQGWTVVYNTDPRGEDLMKADPHIDLLWPQDTNQVPNEMLPSYWQQLGREFDRHVNLSESVEGTLLAMPGRSVHGMPQEARRLLLDINYIDLQHAIAGVAGAPHRPRFYPTPKEDADAQVWRKAMREEPVILWALAGSSVHKVWPHTFQAITRLLTRTDARIVTVGGPREQEIEYGCAQDLATRILGMPAAETEKLNLEELLLRLRAHWGSGRLICASGGWSMRETMAKLPYVDCVVGPETGVLNAASMLDTPKVVMLSHSSNENLTRDWVNTIALTPGVGCYPCHRLHYGFEFCNEDPDTPGVAICQTSIDCDTVLRAITESVQRRSEAA